MVQGFWTKQRYQLQLQLQFMARGSAAKSKMLLLRRGKLGESGLDKLLGSIERGAESERGRVAKSGGGSSCAWWIPHPRTGIYFPAGQERVMEDIPEGAASFAYTCWYRNVDGVDVDNPTLHQYSTLSLSNSLPN